MRSPEDLSETLFEGALTSEDDRKVGVGPGCDNCRTLLDSFGQTSRNEEVVEVGKIAFGRSAGALRVGGG